MIIRLGFLTKMDAITLGCNGTGLNILSIAFQKVINNKSISNKEIGILLRKPCEINEDSNYSQTVNIVSFNLLIKLIFSI